MATMDHCFSNEYRIKDSIAPTPTAFSGTYPTTNIITGENAAIERESVSTSCPKIQWQASVYQHLQGGIGIPSIHWVDIEDVHNAMALDLLGPNLEELFQYTGRKFSLKAILFLADQLLTRIELVHEMSFVHRNLTPEHFVMGIGQLGNLTHIIGFGSSKRYFHSGSHIPEKETEERPGHARYASINAHRGVEQSRRDDIESLGYLMLYFCRGSLPWQGIQADSSRQKYDLVGEKKKATAIQELCAGLPKEFAIYLSYARSLKFDERPDYTYLRRIFRNLFIQEGFQDTYCFDWTVTKYNQAPQWHWKVEYPTLPMQPATREMTEELLLAEAKGIFAALRQVESKCIKIHNLNFDAVLHNVQWQALSKLHETLLDQHYDFFLASQHPSASQALRSQAVSHAMPTRLWKYGIHTLLVHLRHHLPTSSEHISRFLRLAYSRMTLFYQMVPVFRDVWVECLRDLATHSVALEAEGTRSRNTWTSASERWGCEASRRAPTIGRLLHNLVTPLQSPRDIRNAHLPIDPDSQQGSITGSFEQKFERQALHRSIEILHHALRTANDADTILHVHVILSFIVSDALVPESMALLQENMPWQALAELLNSNLPSCHNLDCIDREDFPDRDEKGCGPLPEDFAMGWLNRDQNKSPCGWFSQEEIRLHTTNSDVESTRRERVLWLGGRVSRQDRGLLYDSEKQRFSAGFRVDKDTASVAQQADSLLEKARL